MKLFFPVLLLFPLQGYADVISNIHFTNDYINRGISNSANGSAIQGGIDYYNDIGVYAGIWATTIDYELEQDDPSYEFDIYGGITGELALIEWDIGLLYFTYPNAPSALKLDAHEFHICLLYTSPSPRD